LFPLLLASIRLLVTAVDTFLNHESAAVRPLNLTRRLPDDDNEKRFVFRQPIVAAKLRAVSFLGLSASHLGLMQHRWR
jgi:hypothetical protein